MNKQTIYKYLTGFSVLAATMLPAVAKAQTTNSTTSGGAFLSGAAEMVIQLGLIAVIVLLAMVLKKFGPSVLGLILRFFFLGTLSLFMARMFILLVDKNIFAIGDGSLEFWWHIIFYFAMLMFFLGARALVQLGATGESKVNAKQVMNWTVATVGFIVVVFIAASSFDSSFGAAYVGSPLDSFGAHHFIAVILAGMVVAYLYRVRAKIGLVSKSLSMPLIIALTMLTLQHLWELLSESWEVIKVEDATIEKVEQIFVLLAVVFFFMTVLNLRQLAAAREAPPAQPTPIAPTA